MSLMIVSALLLAQAPAAVQPAPVQKVKKAKPPQICEMMEITGSRAKQRVCRDAEGTLDLGPGISNSLAGKGRIDSQNGGAAATGSSGPGGSN